LAICATVELSYNVVFKMICTSLHLYLEYEKVADTPYRYAVPARTVRTSTGIVAVTVANVIAALLT